jgi:hypothetical protein
MASVRSSRTRLEFQVSLDRTSPLPRERWPEHRGDYVDVFQPYAERYRRRKRFAIWLFIGSLIGGSVFFSINIFDALMGPTTVLIMTGLLVAGLTLVFGRKLVALLAESGSSLLAVPIVRSAAAINSKRASTPTVRHVRVGSLRKMATPRATIAFMGARIAA